MRSRIPLYVLFSLLLIALGAIWFFARGEAQGPSQVFPATIHRDCAPWDGSAFTVSITHPSGTLIYISIWQPPDIPFPAAFSFPDETGQIGAAYILPEIDPFQPLSGEVWFQRVEQGIPVEGWFRFRSEAGAQFEGRFVAQWGDEVLYCG
jgi:hypothetical protein